MSGTNGDTVGVRQEPDLAQAFQELARGEQTAAAMEKNLSAIEKKIEELLAKAEEDERNLKAKSTPSSDEAPSESKDST